MQADVAGAIVVAAGALEQHQLTTAVPAALLLVEGKVVVEHHVVKQVPGIYRTVRRAGGQVPGEAGSRQVAQPGKQSSQVSSGQAGG